jgi:hypothetical protein
VNTEYLWWLAVLLLVGVGAVAFLAFGRLPEIGDEPDGRDGDLIGASEPRPPARATGAPPPDATPAQSAPVNSTVPGPADPVVTSETP